VTLHATGKTVAIKVTNLVQNKVTEALSAARASNGPGTAATVGAPRQTHADAVHTCLRALEAVNAGGASSSALPSSLAAAARLALEDLCTQCGTAPALACPDDTATALIAAVLRYLDDRAAACGV
jgi:membrane protease subunit (stomatin/prohibitin family)